MNRRESRHRPASDLRSYARAASERTPWTAASRRCSAARGYGRPIDADGAKEKALRHDGGTPVSPSWRLGWTSSTWLNVPSASFALDRIHFGGMISPHAGVTRHQNQSVWYLGGEGKLTAQPPKAPGLELGPAHSRRRARSMGSLVRCALDAEERLDHMAGEEHKRPDDRPDRSSERVRDGSSAAANVRR